MVKYCLGDFMLPKYQNELKIIVNTLAATGLVSKLILFGSLARGDQTVDSDIDLCVLTPITDRRPLEISRELRNKLNGKRTLPLDILTFNQVKFYADVERKTSFAHLIEKEGKVLYEAR
ncbi:MAG: nucleotidyltransferase domain-containing protein [Candidatus Margulisbacteria bacterium]|jgi:predicted nucleotidyltransferase|nr:nucleotidyltransferase domain-containing protein [Candidatus Margulisiibacteriota bacterium]